MTGATEFYANPPNLADPALLSATKATLSRFARRGAARATAAAPSRNRPCQDPHEALRRLCRARPREPAHDGTRCRHRSRADSLRENAEFAARLRERHPFAFVDDAQELTGAQLRLLSAIFGEQLAGVTLCGDPCSAISIVAHDATRGDFRPRALEMGSARAFTARRGESVERASTPRDEAESIAERVGDWLAQGFRPEKIAVLFRSVHNVASYEAALLDRNIPVARCRRLNIFSDRRALDALALLWSVYDPFRHDWLLRALASPALGSLRRVACDSLRRAARSAASALRVRRGTGADGAREPMESTTRPATRLERSFAASATRR